MAPRRSLRHLTARGSFCAAALAVGCTTTSAPDPDAQAFAMLQRSFRPQGQATLDRLVQDPLQRACSGEAPPADALRRRLEAEQLASVRPPADGRYLGDWRRGEALAQNGRGMTWTDAPGSANGGSCYNCHQIAPAEIAYGTVGPSLYRYGRLRGVVDPASPAASAVVAYTWAKLYNAKAYNACSLMPRFGEAHLLTTAQLQDLMALLLDPGSPVNR